MIKINMNRIICMSLIVFMALSVPAVDIMHLNIQDSYASTVQYGRTKLQNNAQRHVYDQIKKAVSSKKNAATFNIKKYNISRKNYTYGQQAFYNDHPEYDYSKFVSITLKGSGSKAEVKKLKIQYNQSMYSLKGKFNNKVKAIINGIPKSCKTKYDKALYLHDYLCNHIEYRDKGSNYWWAPAYDALLTGACTCAGYARAYALLLNKAGIKAYPVNVVMKADGVGHATTLFFLNNECYYADVTFDDKAGREPSHAYFCKSKEYMEKDRYFVYSAQGYAYQNEFEKRVLPKCKHNDLKYLAPDITLINDPLNANTISILRNALSDPKYYYDPTDGISKYSRKVSIYYTGKSDLTAFLKNNLFFDGLGGNRWYAISTNGGVIDYEILGTKLL